MNNISKFKVFLPIVFAGCIAGGIYLGSYLTPVSISYDQPGGFNKVNDVLNYIFEEYVDSIDRNDLVESSLTSLLKNLDPHSTYITAEDLKSYSEPLEGNFEGIGIEFNIINDTIIVISPIAGGPSQALGIEAGDRIVKIEGEYVVGIKITNKDVINLLRGPKGTNVDVTVMRRGTTAMIDYTITRGEIPINSVDVSYMVNDSVAYIRINRFSANTYDEFMTAYKSLKRKGLQCLMLDLRGNPGGYLSAATAIADEFLEEGKLIVYTKGKSHPETPYYSTDRSSFVDGDLVVLVDEGSASASEIIAGAVQDNDRGLIIGRRSFGKGLVQEQFIFPDGSGVRLTIARYYTPTGRCIQRPYNNGLDEYYGDIFKRFSKDDKLQGDSSYFSDSLKFTTPGGKVVFGGGGIMPDVYVPIDTIEKNHYLNTIIKKGLISEYAFDYADKSRERLNRYPSIKEYNNKFDISQSELSAFIDFAIARGVSGNPTDIVSSEEIVKTRLKAYVARHIWGERGFYIVIHKIDHSFQTAMGRMVSVE